MARKLSIVSVEYPGAQREPIQTETTMPQGWFAMRLEMDTAGYAADCLRRT